jgi:cysteinyl-tRNA synthetase
MKKTPTDFALWKFSPVWEKRQMERDSPWWLGFPGWHIECSAMSSKYLGEQFDIHHGGADHITIHHPNEIAQSECAFGKKPWVKYRVHNEFLQVDGGKMGKSLGNAYTLEDIKARGFSPLDLRYFYFMAQYSNFQNFTWEALESAKNARRSLIKKLSGKYIKTQQPHQFDFYKKIESVLCDNINTPKLLAEINMGLNTSIPWVFEVISYLEDYFLKLGLFEHQDVVQIPLEIIALAEQRKQAKLDTNYALADELRNKIKELWYELKDNKDGYDITKL